jgi:hypothetical protein
MRVLFQPTQGTPADWRSVDSRDWSSLAPMECHGLNVQGVICDGADHYAIRNLPSGGIKVFLWYDDPEDWPPGMRWARVITVQPLGPDSRLGGAINTNHFHTIYADSLIRSTLQRAYRGNPRVTVEDWSRFTPPQAKVFEGKWVGNGLHEAHLRCRAVRGWREWTDGVDPSEIESGRVRLQRVNVRFLPPDGTRTYYHNPAAGPDIHAAINPNSFGLTPSGAASESATINQNGQTAFSAVTPAGEPASAAWPTTGVYRYQIDATSVGADLSYGLLNLGNGIGHFGRVNAGATADIQTIAQDQSAFTSSGLNIASITDPAWTSGSAGDRFEIVLASVRNAGHGNQDITLQLGEADDFADGPWQAAALSNALFFGTMF